MSYNYIALMKRFVKTHKQQLAYDSDAKMYLILVDYFSDQGQGSNWPESLPMTDGFIANMMGWDIKTVAPARDRLVKRGLLEVQPSEAGSRSGANYHLVNIGQKEPFFPPQEPPKPKPKREPKPAPTYPLNGEVNGQKNGASYPLTYPFNGGANGQLTGEVKPENGALPIQTPIREPVRLLDRSLLNKGIQTPNGQTFSFRTNENKKNEKKNEVVPEGSEDNSVDARKGFQKPPPPTPAPVKLFPTGKVYGSGKLQKLVEEYYEKFPDQFPMSIYTIQKLVWKYTQPYSGQNPDFKGVEVWQTFPVSGKGAWDLENILRIWYERELNPQNGKANAKANFNAAQRRTEPSEVTADDEDF